MLQYRKPKDSPVIPIRSRIYPIPVLITISLRSILILSSLIRLDLLIGFSVKILKVVLSSSIILATWPAHNLLDLITLTILGERYKV